VKHSARLATGRPRESFLAGELSVNLGQANVENPASKLQDAVLLMCTKDSLLASYNSITPQNLKHMPRKQHATHRSMQAQQCTMAHAPYT
jgi:hypothetical protein